MFQAISEILQLRQLLLFIRWLVMLFGLVLALPLAQAAAEKSFHGLDLAQFGKVKNLGGMPELYEMDRTTRRYRLLDSVVQLPFDNAWITYNPDLNVFYLSSVPGEKASTYYGPVEGDPFDMFKLEERMISKFREDYAGDEMYRVSLMIRSGNPKLRERALRVMTAALAPDVSAQTRAYYIAKFRELTSGLQGEDVKPVLSRIEQTEAEIEKLTVTIPDEQYSPGNDALEKQGKLQDWMKPSVLVPESAWGTPVDGLRAAAVFSSVTPSVGEKVEVWLLVENVSDHGIKFGSSDVVQSSRAVVKREDGSEIRVESAWYSGLSPIQHHILQPKERLTLAKKGLVFENVQGGEGIGFGGGRAQAGSGDYRAHYESVLSTGSAWSRDEKDGKMHRTYPAKGEWSGTLVTGETKLTVKEKK